MQIHTSLVNRMFLEQLANKSSAVESIRAHDDPMLISKKAPAKLPATSNAENIARRSIKGFEIEAMLGTFQSPSNLRELAGAYLVRSKKAIARCLNIGIRQCTHNALAVNSLPVQLEVAHSCQRPGMKKPSASGASSRSSVMKPCNHCSSRFGSSESGAEFGKVFRGGELLSISRAN
jgi:hypothetical protein